MSERVITLTPKALNRIISEVASEFVSEVLETKEDDVEDVAKKTRELKSACEYADTVEKPVDWLKLQKIKENLNRKERDLFNQLLEVKKTKEKVKKLEKAKKAKKDAKEKKAKEDKEKADKAKKDKAKKK